MKNKSALLLASLIASSTHAGTMGKQQSVWNWIGTLSMGPTWENGGKKQTFYLAPEIEKTYTANRSKKTLFDGEVFIGLQKKISPSLLSQLGLAIAATTNARLSGYIWDDADPQFDNYSYNYKVQHTYLALKGKLLVNTINRFIPWICGSVGIGFNHTYGYSNTPLIYEAVPNPNFASRTQTAFSYTVGAGVQKTLNAHWQIGAGYEFADWGKSKLGRAAGQTLNSGLGLNHLYTNGVLFNLTYVA